MVGSVHVRDFNPSIGAYRWNWKFTAYPAHHIHRQNTHSKNVSRWKNQGKGKEKDALWREKVLAFCLEPTCNVWDANEPCHKCNQTWPKRKIRSYKARRIAPRETAKKGKGGHQCPTNTPFAPHKRKCCVHTSLWIAHNLVAHTAINTVDGTNAEHVSDKSGSSLHSCLPTLQSICRWLPIYKIAHTKKKRYNHSAAHLLLEMHRKRNEHVNNVVAGSCPTTVTEQPKQAPHIQKWIWTWSERNRSEKSWLTMNRKLKEKNTNWWREAYKTWCPHSPPAGPLLPAPPPNTMSFIQPNKQNEKKNNRNTS